VGCRAAADDDDDHKQDCCINRFSICILLLLSVESNQENEHSEVAMVVKPSRSVMCTVLNDCNSEIVGSNPIPE
jgi:hypothetical protein